MARDVDSVAYKTQDTATDIRRQRDLTPTTRKGARARTSTPEMDAASQAIYHYSGTLCNRATVDTNQNEQVEVEEG